MRISWKKSKLWKWGFLFCAVPAHPTQLMLLWTDSDANHWQPRIDPGNFKLLWHAEAAGVTAFWFTEAVCHFAKKKKKCECLWWWRMRLDVWRKHSVARRTWESRCGRHLSSVLGATHFTDSVWKGIAGWEAVIECNCVWQPETTASKHRTCWKMKIEVHLGTWKNKLHLFFSFRFFSNVSKQLYPPELYGPVSNVKKQKPFQ